MEDPRAAGDALGKIERYTLLEELERADHPGVRIFAARDALFPDARVRLSIVSTRGGFERSIEALRRDARRAAQIAPQLEVRIFEDLPRGTMGVAYRSRGKPSATKLDGPAPEPAQESAREPTSSSRGARRSWPVALGVIALGMLAAAALTVGLGLAGRDEDETGDDQTRGETDDLDTTDARRRKPSAAPIPTRIVTTAAPPACGSDQLAIDSGCLDVRAVTRDELLACAACIRVPASIAAPAGADALPDVIACQGSMSPRSEPARCVTWDQARAFCEQQGKRLPSLDEWREAEAKGFKTRSSYEWTSSKWTDGGMMRKTGAERSPDAQMHLALVAPNLGFRCLLPR